VTVEDYRGLASRRPWLAVALALILILLLFIFVFDRRH